MQSVEAEQGAAGSQLIAWCAAAEALLYHARKERAEQMMKRILELEDRIAAPEPAASPRLYSLRCYRAYFDGDASACLRWVKLAIASYRVTCDVGNIRVWETFEGQLYLDLGLFTLVKGTLQGTLNDFDRVGIHERAAILRTILGSALARRGEFEEAEATQLDAIRAFATRQDRRMQGFAHTYLAVAHLLRDDAVGAEREACSAINLM